MYRPLLRFGLALLLAGSLPAASILSSCSSDKTEDPKPTTGSLAGTVSPAGAIGKVTATDAGGLTFVGTPDATTGAFSITDLKPGNYTLSFTPTAGYVAPAERTITIVAGEKVAAGTVSVESDGSLRSGTLNWRVDGTSYTATTVTGSIGDLGMGGKTLSIEATAVNGSTSDQLSLVVGSFTPAVGTYELGNVYYRSAAYQRTSGGIITATYGGQYMASGTVTISSYDASTRTLTGTFGFSAAGQGSTSGILDVSNGTFTLRF